MHWLNIPYFCISNPLCSFEETVLEICLLGRLSNEMFNIVQTEFDKYGPSVADTGLSHQFSFHAHILDLSFSLSHFLCYILLTLCSPSLLHRGNSSELWREHVPENHNADHHAHGGRGFSAAFCVSAGVRPAHGHHLQGLGWHPAAGTGRRPCQTYCQPR